MAACNFNPCMICFCRDGTLLAVLKEDHLEIRWWMSTASAWAISLHVCVELHNLYSTHPLYSTWLYLSIIYLFYLTDAQYAGLLWTSLSLLWPHVKVIKLWQSWHQFYMMTYYVVSYTCVLIVIVTLAVQACLPLITPCTLTSTVPVDPLPCHRRLAWDNEGTTLAVGLRFVRGLHNSTCMCHHGSTFFIFPQFVTIIIISCQVLLSTCHLYSRGISHHFFPP